MASAYQENVTFADLNVAACNDFLRGFEWHFTQGEARVLNTVFLSVCSVVE